MMQFLTERFAPGPVFGWMCVAMLALLPLIWLRQGRRTWRVPLRFSSAMSLRRLGDTWVTRTRLLPPLLRTLAVIALIVAMARPQSTGAYSASAEGIAIQMVLDVSGSMAEEDFFLDGDWVRRLDAVKRVFRDFVIGAGGLPGRDNDLIGMSTFAMFADTPCPLTTDHGTLVDLLEETEIPGWVDGRQMREDQEAGFTALGDAIVLATDDLRRAGEQALANVPGAEAAKSKVMILLTDGADNPPEFRNAPRAPDPLEAARVAARLGIKVYTIGAVGAERKRTSGFSIFGGRRRQVDEQLLKRIADASGAKYFRATDTDSLRTIYEEIDKLERRATGERSYHDNIFAAKVAMLTGLGLLLAEFLLVNTRYRRVP